MKRHRVEARISARRVVSELLDTGAKRGKRNKDAGTSTGVLPLTALKVPRESDGDLTEFE